MQMQVSYLSFPFGKLGKKKTMSHAAEILHQNSTNPYTCQRGCVKAFPFDNSPTICHTIAVRSFLPQA